jgi:hypothetical protein
MIGRAGTGLKKEEQVKAAMGKHLHEAGGGVAPQCERKINAIDQTRVQARVKLPSHSARKYDTRKALACNTHRCLKSNTEGREVEKSKKPQDRAQEINDSAHCHHEPAT